MSKVKTFDMGGGISIPARKVQVLAEVAGVPYERTIVNLHEGEQKGKYAADLPAGKVPAINDNGLVIHESNAIVRYLAAKYAPELYPADLAKRAKIDEAVEYLRGTIEPACGMVGFHKWFKPLLLKQELNAEGLAKALEDVEVKLAAVEKLYFQSETKFLVNDELSVADTNAFCALHQLTAESAGFDWSKHANVKKYYDGLKAHEKFTSVDKVLANFAEVSKTEN